MLKILYKKIDNLKKMKVVIILLTICSLFVLIELTGGVLILAISKAFYLYFYNAFVELMNLQLLIFNSVNLIFYCSMSAEFKKNFNQLRKNFLF